MADECAGSAVPVEGDTDASPRLSASEDATAWAIAHFGGAASLTDALAQEVRTGVHARVSSLPESHTERFSALESWREQSRLNDRLESRVVSGREAVHSPRGRWGRTVEHLVANGPVVGKAVGVRAQLGVLRVACAEQVSMEGPIRADSGAPIRLHSLCELDRNSMDKVLASIGAWQVAAMVADKGRRRAARVGSKIPAISRKFFEHGLSANADLPLVATTRLQEVFLGLQRRELAIESVLERLGLFALACAAGGRFERRFAAWVADIPAELGARARQFFHLNPRALRHRLGVHFRNSLNCFWQIHRDEFDEDSESGGVHES